MEITKLFFYFTVVVIATISGFNNVAAQESNEITTERLTYHQHNNSAKSQSMTVYRMASRNENNKAPAILFFHGGGWVTGAPIQFRRQAEILAQRGMVVANVEYPLDGDPIKATRIAQTALCWFRQNAALFNIDLRKIAVSGGSAGGQIAVASALTDWKSNPACKNTEGVLANAIILFNPVLDMKGKWESKFNTNLQTVSPIDLLTQSLPPTLILQGDSDKVTPLKIVETFVSKAKDVGSPNVNLRIYKGEGHGFFNRRKFDATTADVVNFFESLGWIKREKTR